MSVISFDIEEHNNAINDEKEESLINNSRYEVKSLNPSSNQINFENPKNKKKCPFLFYIFLFSLIILIGFILFTLITKLSKKENYTLDDNIYLKPEISNNNYTTVKFNNGLELLLIKVDENDTAGGIIAFDTGYLDTDYENEVGYLKLAFLSLITYEVKNSIKLIDYLGKFDYSIEEHYSFFSFSILNSGFFEYLEIFSQLTYLSPENNDSRFENITKNINLLSMDLNNQKGNIKKIENHFLENLVYGYKDNLKIDLDDSKLNRIKEIMKSLLNPSRMKIILNSHFKMSLMKNKFIKYFNNIINKDISKENKNNYNNIKKDLAKQQVIYMNLPDYATNYIKIIYFIEGIKNIENYKDYEDLYIDSGYFNYIKYILDGTNKDSLYYKLTNSEEYNIKSLSCDFEVVLKSKIKFSINIDLNYYSYKNLNNIIYITYEYVNKIKNHIRTLEKTETQIKELYRIMKQNFSYTEDFHDNTKINKKRAINLFCKNNKLYFLRDIWFKNEFNVTTMNRYTEQLTPKNSVLIIGINNYALGKFGNDLKNSNFSSVIFKETTNNNYSDIYCNNDSLNIEFENKFNNDSNIGNDENEYISKYNYSIGYNPNVKFTDDDSLPEQIESNNSLRVFYYKRVTSFGVPKVYIILNFYHPFLRPGYGPKDFRDKTFFQIMLYRAYIKREIDLQLGDAIRAGNSINMGFNQNLFFIDIFAFEDVVEKIMNKIKDIISYNFESNDSKFFKKFEIYKDSALEELYSIYQNSNLDFRMRMNFYETLYNKDKSVPIYNYFKFPKKEYRNKTKADIIDSDDEYNFITKSIIHGNIFGYCDKTLAENIYKIFNVNNDDINILLNKANLSNFNLNSSNFQEWMTQKYNLETSINISDYNCTDNGISEYLFIHWSPYNLKDLIISNVLDVIINSDYNNKSNSNNNNNTNLTLIKSKVFSQGEIYIQINSYNKSIDYNENIKNILDHYENIYINMVDSIGNRLYYLLKSLAINQYAKREDLKSSAITMSDITTHAKIDYSELNNCKNYNYNEIKNITGAHIKDNKYVNFICKKHNKF